MRRRQGLKKKKKERYYYTEAKTHKKCLGAQTHHQHQSIITNMMTCNKRGRFQCPSPQATSHSADSMILTVARKIKWASISNRSPSRKGSLTEKPKHSRGSDGEHGEPGPTGQGHGSTGICCNRARGPRRRRGTVQVGAYAPLARPGPIDDRSSGLGEQGFATRGTNHWARFHGLIAARNPSRHQ